jgi:hypothetical protein
MREVLPLASLVLRVMHVGVQPLLIASARCRFHSGLQGVFPRLRWIGLPAFLPPPDLHMHSEGQLPPEFIRQACVLRHNLHEQLFVETVTEHKSLATTGLAFFCSSRLETTWIPQTRNFHPEGLFDLDMGAFWILDRFMVFAPSRINRRGLPRIRGTSPIRRGGCGTRLFDWCTSHKSTIMR